MREAPFSKGVLSIISIKLLYKHYGYGLPFLIYKFQLKKRFLRIYRRLFFFVVLFFSFGSFFFVIVVHYLFVVLGFFGFLFSFKSLFSACGSCF